VKASAVLLFERMIMKRPIVNCPQCGKIIAYDPANPYRPFCSERCKLIDLGQWAAEAYRIPEAEKKEEDENGEDEK
jgi:endogenous inhibitor of DNA gyrase (YacG/DUF329 family)